MTISKQFLSKMAFATLIVSILLGALALRAGENPENTQQEAGALQEQSMPEGTIVDIHGFGALAQDEIEIAREQGEVDPRDKEIAQLKEDIEFWKKYFDKHETMIVNDNLLAVGMNVALVTTIGAAVGHKHNGVQGALEYGFGAYTVTGLIHGFEFLINGEKLRDKNHKKYYRAGAILAGPALTLVAVSGLYQTGTIAVWEAGLVKKFCSSVAHAAANRLSSK